MKTSNKQYPPTMVIEKCTQCTHCVVKPMYTADSWERANDWFCAKDMTSEEPRKIQGYVEWMDKVEVPTWCPLRVRRKKEKI